jgi:putative ABC transport system substrate-binding protein
VRARVEIIVTAGTPATLAAKRATTTVPIVFRYAGAPVLTGLVASLARPGGNVTGFAGTGPEITTKSLSLLKELLPQLHRVGVLEPRGDPYARAGRQFEQVCRSLDLEPVFVEITQTSEIRAAIGELVRKGVQALVVPNESPMSERGLEIVDVATKHRLPTMSDGADLAREAGVLIAYSASLVEYARIRAYYIDRILRGAKPADLPVRQSTKFELVINLKTAKALDITVPKELLLRADEVIQ